MAKMYFTRSGRPYGYCVKCGKKNPPYFLKENESGEFVCYECRNEVKKPEVNQ